MHKNDTQSVVNAKRLANNKCENDSILRIYVNRIVLSDDVYNVVWETQR